MGYLPNTFGIETHIFELFKLALPPTRVRLPRSLASRKTLLVVNRWSFHVRPNSKTSTRNESTRREDWQQRSVFSESTDSMKVLQAISLFATQFKPTAFGSTRSVSRSVTSANPILFL